MSEETMLTIKTKLDTKGFDDLEASAGRSLENISRDVDAFNKSTRVSPDTKEFKKKIEEAGKLLDELTAKREIVIAKPNTEAVKKELNKLDGFISNITRTREILIGLDERELSRTEDEISRVEERLDSLEETREVSVEVAVDAANVEDAESSTEDLNAELDKVNGKRSIDIDASELDGAALNAVSNLVDGLDGVTKSATKAMAGVVGVSERTASGVTKVIQSLSGMSTLIAGPLAIAIVGAVSGLSSYVMGLTKAGDASKETEARLESISKYYKKLASDADAATTATENQIQAQVRLIEANIKVARAAAESYLEDVRKFQQANAVAAGEITGSFKAAGDAVKLGFIDPIRGVVAMPEFDAFANKISEISARVIEASKDTETYGGEVQLAGTELEAVRTELGLLLKQDDWTTRQRAGIENLITRTNSLTLTLGSLREEWAKVITLGQDQQDVQNALSRQIEQGFRRTVDGITETRKQAVKDAEELVKKSGSLDAEQQKKAASVLKQAQDDLKAHEDRQNKTTTSVRKKAVKAEEDQIEALNKRYAAQQEIASQTISDQEELTATLLVIEKAYYAELERLTRVNYEKQIAQGKALTDAQVVELQRIIEKNKELSTQEDSLQVLEETYNTRVNIAKKTVNEEEKLEEELMALRRQFLQEKLNLLMQEAETAMKLRGEIRDDTIAAIREVKKELDAIGGEDNNMAQRVSQQISQWGGLLNSMASSLGSFMDAQYDARIKSLDASLDRELRMIENAFEQQNALYEEQLKQYEDLEERRTAIQEEYDDARESLNWKAQEHVTEDEYRAIMEQMAQEEEKYNESMMRLEEDTLQRDEIRLQQELSEQAYLARKEELEKEYAIKRAQMERKQAQAQQATAIFSAFIFTATGIARALAEFIWPLNIAVGAIVGAAGAVQIAAIASRPLPSIPSYHVGGIIGGGNIQDYGHLPGPDNPHDKTLFWGQEGEYVLPVDESQAYQFLRAHGQNMQGLADRVRMQSTASITGSAAGASVDNSRVITHSQTYYVDKEPSFSEKRRQQKMVTRSFIRGLA